MLRKINYETSHKFHCLFINVYLWHNADDKVGICNNTDNEVFLVEKKITVDKV